jgi:hypothetical protein
LGFGLLDGKVGFALDIALHVGDSYGTDPVGGILLDQTIEMAKQYK